MSVISKAIRISIALLFMKIIRTHETFSLDGNFVDAKTDGTGFWLTTELINIGFRRGCLSTALCNKPVFKIIHTLALNGENTIFSWPFIQDEQIRSFVTFWKQGEPDDISLTCQIAGTDPSFGFTRVCDETPNRRIFSNAIFQLINAHSRGKSEFSTSNHYSKENTGSKNGTSIQQAELNDPDKTIVELRGRCFNATLRVRKYQTRCPWCPDPNVQIVVGTATSGQVSEQREGIQQETTDPLFLHNCVILALCGAVIFALTGLFSLTIFHCRYRHHSQKRKRSKKCLIVSSNSSKKKRTLLKVIGPPPILNSPNQNSLQSSTTAREGKFSLVPSSRDQAYPTSEEQRYESPWDNRPIYQQQQQANSMISAPSFRPYNSSYDAPEVNFQRVNPMVMTNSCQYQAIVDERIENLRDRLNFYGERTQHYPYMSAELIPGFDHKFPIHPPPPPMPVPTHESAINDSQQNNFSPNKTSSSLGRNEDSGLESI